MSLKNRILTERGFVYPDAVEKKKDLSSEVSRLQAENARLKMLLKDRDNHWETLRDVKRNKLADKAKAAVAGERKAKQEVSKLNKELKEKEAKVKNTKSKKKD